jgi:hypothetical protein
MLLGGSRLLWEEKNMMKNLHLGVALAAILTAMCPVTPAFVATAVAAAPAPAALVIPAADARTLRAWIIGQNTASVPAPAGFTVAVGAVVPMTVMLRPVTRTPPVAVVGMNQYAIIGDKIVLVNPMDRKIVYVFM